MFGAPFRTREAVVHHFFAARARSGIIEFECLFSRCAVC